jgi:hypothetical protein
MEKESVVFDGEIHQGSNGKYYARVNIYTSGIITSSTSADVETDLEAEELLIKTIESKVCKLKDKNPEMNTKRFWNNVEMKQA